ncbi:serine/threonine protein kinase [Catalinimonas alkaloidigena]|uniref:protein kinase domain-containing protein n=1 Tax=Catalinimonas alkaloidigena TaxID=1075417 RepID=UPI002405FBF1|nr:hypothetical protein [Catalinimonas alkaloidigena]MDF9800551.1 serine/threonine protein kinase [Catalinimonas alkaloidigena]
MENQYFTSQGICINIQCLPFQSGGEGEVFSIVSPDDYKNKCAKIFYPSKRNDIRKKKLEFMVANSPPKLEEEQYRICWPLTLLYQHNSFVGFIMPLAYSNSIQLYELCTPKIKPKLLPEWSKFDRTTGEGVVIRLKLCVNIAIAIHIIHCMKKYVLVDMKPQNILVNQIGNISIIDLDSIQISNGKKVAFYGPVATPEYVPPEGIQLKPNENHIPSSWDLFSLAVIFYEIIFGLHPFAATANGKYETCTTISDKISSGLFPYGSNSKFITMMPPLHHNFTLLPNVLQSYFIRAFDNKIFKPEHRPSSEMWGKFFFKEINQPSKRNKSRVKLGSSNIYKPKSNINPEIKINSSKTVLLSAKISNNTYAETSWIIAALCHLMLFGTGLFYVDKSIKRKWVYPLSVTYCIIATYLSEKVLIFGTELGFISIIVGVFVGYFIGLIDTLATLYNRKNL